MPDPVETEQDGMEGLRCIFSPRSVAVIGASRDPSSMSGRLFRNLLASFQGPVYPVNPHATEIASIPTYPFILAVPGPVDLAFITVPVGMALDAVRECIGKGVHGLVVITGGFSETGEAGRELQLELRDMVRAAGIRMVGPNCFGVFNTDPTIRLQGTFAGATTPPGNIGIGAQSGALGVVIPDYLGQWRLGASTFASIGNKADVSENDLLAYWRDDPATEVILLYLESFSDPVEFLQLAREISRQKPIVALKAARTDVGRRAAGSHTAAIVSPNRASEALLSQSGVVRVETLEELFEVAALLSSQPLPRGDRVAILTNAGGPGILCADTLATRGLLLPEPSAPLQAGLRKLLRAEAAVKNPVDLIGTIDADEYRRCLELLLSSREFDAVISIYVPREPGTSSTIARAIREATETWAEGTTSLAVLMQTDELPEELRGATERLPGYRYPEAAAKALAYARSYARWREIPKRHISDFPDIGKEACRRVIEPVLDRADTTGGWLEPEEVHQLLDAAGVRVPRWRVASSAEEAVAIAADWMRPVVVKAIAPGLLHKSDVGGVVVNVTGDTAVRDAFRQVTSAVPIARGALLQEFLPRGEEAFIGVVRDPRFGHLLALGCGGTLVELLEDVVCRLHPLTDEDATEMFSHLRTAALLTGYRGRAPADVGALKELLLRVSRLITLVPEIAELDLNPVLVQPVGSGVMVPDARVRIAHGELTPDAAHSAR